MANIAALAMRVLTYSNRIPLLQVCPIDVRTDMAEFVQIRDIGHRKSMGPENAKARAGARASE